MALNLGTLFFRMGADTRGLEKATRNSYWTHKLEQGTQFFTMSLSLDNTMKTYTVRFIGDYSATKIDDAHWNVSGTLETYSGATPNIMTESDLDTALGGGGGGSTSEEEFYNMPILILKDATSGALTHTLPSTASSTNQSTQRLPVLR